MANGNISDFEDLDEDDTEFDPDVLFRHTAEDVSEEEQDIEEVPSSSVAILPEPPSPPCALPDPPNVTTTARQSRSTVRESRCSPSTSHRSRSPVSNRGRRPSRGRGAASVPRLTRKRILKQTAFTEMAHNYFTLPINPVKRPIEYFYDYFDTQLLEKISHCSNLFYLRTTGRELKSSRTERFEIAKLFAIHLIMGCIRYPRLPMYWNVGMKLGLISDLMTRDRFLTLRNALHVVESDSPAPNEVDNPLWKVQPTIDKYYRAFIKTKKWTLKVLIHFFDLAVVNAWRLYKNNCSANKLPRKDTMPLLDFRMNLADSLSCIPDRSPPDDTEPVSQEPRRDY